MTFTKGERAVLAFIITFTEKNGYPPSVREMGDGLGLTSKRTVADRLFTLARKRALAKFPLGHNRAWRVVNGFMGKLRCDDEPAAYILEQVAS